MNADFPTGYVLKKHCSSLWEGYSSPNSSARPQMIWEDYPAKSSGPKLEEPERDFAPALR